MQAKLKICTGGCGLKKIIWKNHQGKKYCLACWNIYQSKNQLKVTTPGKKYKIRPASEKRLEALKTYRRKREKYFKEHPVCEFPGCSSTEVDLHHKKGREGSLLTDKRYFCSLCRYHHNWVHENDAEARKMGLLLSRLENGNV